MQIIPLHLYRPEALNFRIKNRDYAVLKVAPEAALFVDATPALHAKAFLLGLNNRVSAFYLSGERLVVGEATHSKHGLYFECEIRDEIVITACIGILSDEQYAALRPISSSGINLTRNAFTQVSVVGIEGEDTNFVFEESPFPFNPFDDHRTKWMLQIGKDGQYVIYHQEMPTCAWRSPSEVADEGACEWQMDSLGRDELPPLHRVRDVLPGCKLETSFVFPEPLLSKWIAENPGHEELIEHILFSNADQRVTHHPVYPDGNHEVLIVEENPSIALLGRRILSGYTVSRMLIIGEVIDRREALLTQLFNANGLLPLNQTLALTAEDHRKMMGLLGSKPSEVKALTASVQPPLPAPEVVHAFNGMSVSVAKRKAVVAKPLANTSPSNAKPKVNKKNEPLLKISSFSRLEPDGIAVEVVWKYKKLRESLVYRFMPSAMEDFQIFCEVLAVRDVLLNRTKARNVPLRVGAQDIELVVSKGAIKRMIRSDSVKLKTIWSAARYLMARCCFSKVDVQKESPLSDTDKPIETVISLSVDESFECIPSALGPVRFSHHALKRVMERRSELSENSWSYALQAIESAEHVTASGAFDRLKHEKDALYLMSAAWRFVVVDSKGGKGGVVLTAFPNKRALPAARTKIA